MAGRLRGGGRRRAEPRHGDRRGSPGVHDRAEPGLHRPAPHRHRHGRAQPPQRAGHTRIRLAAAGAPGGRTSPDGALPGPVVLALSSRTRIGTVERANAIAAATLPAEAQRRLTVMPVELTTGYRRPDGQWPPRCPVAWLVHEFNARVASHVETPDPHDRRLGPDQFVVSLRHYKPAESELSRERLKRALSTAQGLLLQPRGEGELIELSDDEAVAAAVMLPMVAPTPGAFGLKPHRRRVQAQSPRDRLKR